MSFSISASAPKKDIRAAIEQQNQSYARTDGYGILAKVPDIIDLATEGYHESTVVAVTVSGHTSDAQTTLAINITTNPNGLIPTYTPA